jgi:hypothetical protein
VARNPGYPVVPSLESYLRTACGFSRENARIAVSMERAGELSQTEKEVINSIQLNLGSEGIPFLAKNASVLNHLNYRISTNDTGRS